MDIMPVIGTQIRFPCRLVETAVRWPSLYIHIYILILLSPTTYVITKQESPFNHGSGFIKHFKVANQFLNGEKCG